MNAKRIASLHARLFRMIGLEIDWTIRHDHAQGCPYESLAITAIEPLFFFELQVASKLIFIVFLGGGVKKFYWSTSSVGDN